MQLSREEIFNKLKYMLSVADENHNSYLNDNSITENSDLINDLGFSSVNLLYMVIAIEESFNVQFDDVSISDFRTIKDVIDYIQEKS